MWHHLKPLAFCAASLALAAGCTHTRTTGSTAAPPLPPAATAPAVEPAPAAQSADPSKGTVAEVFQAGRYSYVSVDSGSGRRWYAIPSAEVKVGQQVELQPGMEVRNYQAKSLNRTFDSIFFTDGLTIATPAKESKDPIPSGHGSVGKRAGIKRSISGRVVEVIRSTTFDFVSVENEAARSWVAVPEGTVVSVGQELKFLAGDEIRGFTSNTLNRSFDSIVFSGGIDRSQKK